MASARLLIVDDDEELCQLAARRFAKEGHEIVAASTGAEGLDLVREVRPAAVMLDIGLPDMDGASLCEQVRNMTDVPILVLTADVSATTAVQALELGATDYIRKPVDLGELVARVRAALRPVTLPAAQAKVITVGPLCLYEGYNVGTYAAEDIGLSASEFKVLAFLAQRPGSVLAKDQLLRALWDDERAPHLIEVHVSHIRRKLRDAGCADEVIRTVHTAGYVFVPPQNTTT